MNLPIIEYLRPLRDKLQETKDIKKAISLLNDKDKEIFDYLYVRSDKDLKYLILHYNDKCAYDDKWNDFNGALRDCRGLVIAADTLNPIIRPYSKFFNIGEKPETQENLVLERINKASVIEFADKMDGSLLCMRYYDNDYLMASSGVIDNSDNNSVVLTEATKLLTDNDRNLLKTYNKYTFMFELISLKDPHIVDYTNKEQGLYLHGMRDMETDKCLPYSEVIKIADQFGVKHIDFIPTKDINKINEIRKTEKSEDKEGFVLYVDGFYVKMKCEDYLRQAIFIKNVLNENNLIKIYVNKDMDFFDDIKGSVFEKPVNDILDVIKKYEDTIIKTSKEILDEIYDENRKNFFTKLYTAKYPKYLTNTIAYMYLGRDLQILKSHNESSPKYISYKELNENLDELALFKEKSIKDKESDIEYDR